MPTLKFASPPPQQEQFGSANWHNWFRDVSERLSGTFKIPNPYPDQIHIKGTYPGVGQLKVEQTAFSGDHVWAIYGSAIARTADVAGPVVGGGFQGYHRTGAASGAYVWGIATEAWSGTAEEEPTLSATLQNEVSVISQYHQNMAALVGLNVVFKNRSDALYGGKPLHNAVGNNGYSRYSIGLQFDSQPRSSLGEYCGFNTGILFGANSIDSTTDPTGTVEVKGCGIDMRQIPAGRLISAISLSEDHNIHFEGARNVAVRYDGTFHRWGLWYSGTEVFAIANDGSGKPYFLSNTASGAAAGLDTLPSNPKGFWVISLGGTNVKVPYYGM